MNARQRHPPVDLRHAARRGARLRRDSRPRTLPRIVNGDLHVCFGVTEPGAGLDTSRITTFAKREGDTYVVNGRKVWISKALESEKILLLTRTTPYDEVTKKTDGMTLFLTDLDRDHVDIRPIKKMGRNAVSSNELFIDDLSVPVEDRVGEEGKGFKYILDGLNPERMLIAAEALGIGRVALDKAVKYANERVVFDRPIGMNQGIQFPLADSLARLDAAELMLRKATWLYDNGKPCGREANTAKYLCADAGFGAADRALQTHGGMGYSEEYHVSRYFRESRLMKIAPVSQEMILNFLGEHVLGPAEELLMGIFRPDRPLRDGDGCRCRRGYRRRRCRRPGRSGRRSARHRHRRRRGRCRCSTHSKRRWQGRLVCALDVGDRAAADAAAAQAAGLGGERCTSSSTTQASRRPPCSPS